jgi:hypothetical protein
VFRQTCEEEEEKEEKEEKKRMVAREDTATDRERERERERVGGTRRQSSTNDNLSLNVTDERFRTNCH